MIGASRYRIVLALLSAVTAALFVLSLVTGPAGIGFSDALASLYSGGDQGAGLIMREIRLPRAILGLMIGITLGLSGAALQGYLRNPLAEPGLLGISASASLGAVIAIYTGFSAVFPLGLPLAALVGSVVAVLVVQAMAGARGGALTVILAGVAVSSFAAAMTSLALNLSPNPFAALEIMFWMLGSLTDRSMTHVWLAGPFMVAGWAMLAALGRPLDALTLGEDAAQALGTDLRRTRLRLLIGTAIGVGGAVAVSGSIGFVGLIVPHLIRPLTDRSPSAILLPSAIGGAALLTLADLGVRIIPTTNELKLGVVTAFLGVPVFLVHLMRERRLW